MPILKLKLSVESLPKMDVGKTQWCDPYVIVLRSDNGGILRECHRTKIVKNCKDADFDEFEVKSHDFRITNDSGFKKNILYFRVMDNDFLSGDDYIGLAPAVVRKRPS